MALATAALLAGCFGNEPTNLGDNEEPFDVEVEVQLINTGDGSGGVDVAFEAGTVDNPCPDVLGPDESCTVAAQHTAEIAWASFNAIGGEFSTFNGYGGDCSGTEPECTIDLTGENDINAEVLILFELVVARIDFDPTEVAVGVGADAGVTASAFADLVGEHPVEEAEFAWESSDATVATVVDASPTSATVTGLQAGQAWIRATARGTTDSVRVVVGG